MAWPLGASRLRPQGRGASRKHADAETTGVSDDHPGLKAALTARLPGVPWQRCQVHLQRNAMALVSRQEQRAEVARDLRGIFNSLDRSEADTRLKAAAEK